MRVLLATDAWHPQVNGVVRTLERLKAECEAMGHDVAVVSPQGFRTVPLPSYPEIRLALTSAGRIDRAVREIAPDFIHVVTEGPVGGAVRRWCIRNGRPFTTSYHTRFPEYVAARAPIPVGLTYRWLRRFHNAGRATLVTTDSLADELRGRGFASVAHWPRGVDCELFRPREASVLDLPRPIFLYVGRVAVEKSIDAFLALDLPGSKVVVGDGPQRAELQRRFGAAHFLGTRQGEELAAIYASADVFVFPSRTDTLGLVVLEALASGVPVAAYPVTGPRDLIGMSGTGVLDEDLRAAALKALEIPREACRAHALTFSWAECARIFLAHLEAYQGELPSAAA